MLKNVNFPKNSITYIILRYGLVRDDGLKRRIHEELLATENYDGARHYSQAVHEVLVAVVSEYLRGRRPATTDITILTGIPNSSARRRVSFLEQIGIVSQFKDPNDGRRYFIGLTKPYQRIIDSFVDDCAIEFADIINIFDEREQEETDRKYQSLLNNTTVGIGRFRLSDRKIILANEKLVEMFGGTSIDEFVEEFVFSDHYVDPDEQIRLIDHYERYPGQLSNSIHFTHNGYDIHVETSGQVDKKNGHCDFVVIDISERRQAGSKSVV